MPAVLQALEQLSHRGVQTSGNHLQVMIPTSRLPCSISEMCPLFISKWTARSVCVHPLLFRNAWMRFPN
jgi:hypothetical protein